MAWLGFPVVLLFLHILAKKVIAVRKMFIFEMFYDLSPWYLKLIIIIWLIFTYWALVIAVPELIAL